MESKIINFNEFKQLQPLSQLGESLKSQVTELYEKQRLVCTKLKVTKNAKTAVVYKVDEYARTPKYEFFVSFKVR